MDTLFDMGSYQDTSSLMDSMLLNDMADALSGNSSFSSWTYAELYPTTGDDIYDNSFYNPSPFGSFNSYESDSIYGESYSPESVEVNALNDDREESPFTGSENTASLSYSPQSATMDVFNDNREDSPLAEVQDTATLLAPESAVLVWLFRSTHFRAAFPKAQLGFGTTLPSRFSVHQQESDCVTHEEAAIKLICIDRTGGRMIRRSFYLCTNVLSQGCRQVTNSSGDMTRHQAKHSVDRPFKCNECQDKFARKDSLVRHSKTHDKKSSKQKVKKIKTAAAASAKVKAMKGREGRKGGD